MIRIFQFAFGIIFLIGLEVMKVYFIMPFPGSQRSESVDLAYFIHSNIFWLRTIGLLIIAFPAFYFLVYGKLTAKIATIAALIAFLVVVYFFNFRFLAEKMFYQPKTKLLAESTSNKVAPSSLVIGVSLEGESKAYPIEIIGYHHQVRDTVGGVPVMITYCTVCRTGRVYSPDVQGKPETFRLVGMDHFNAMFEDATTGSWWRQVSGEAIAGPLKGEALKEITSLQMTLRAWTDLHPETKVLQPDPAFKSEYEGLEGFDRGTIESGLEKRDSASWHDKSWVLGVQIGMAARAYDWNDLVQKRILNDTLDGTTLLIAIEGDSASFHVWRRDTLTFNLTNEKLFDLETNSRWTWSGKSVEGKLSGTQLISVQSYQEFWHSWRTFHPQTTQYPQR